MKVTAAVFLFIALGVLFVSPMRKILCSHRFSAIRYPAMHGRLFLFFKQPSM